MGIYRRNMLNFRELRDLINKDSWLSFFVVKIENFNLNNNISFYCNRLLNKTAKNIRKSFYQKFF